MKGELGAMFGTSERNIVRGVGLVAVLVIAMILVGRLGAGAAAVGHVSFLPIAHRGLPLADPMPPPELFIAVADATIVQGHADRNLGDVIQIVVGYDNLQDPIGQTLRGLVYFDVSEVPLGTQITSSTLLLHLTSSYDFGLGIERTVTTRRVTEPWSESTVTWNTAPGYAEAYGSAAVGHWEYGWYPFDVTALVQAWIDGEHPNYGIMLQAHEGLEPVWRGFSAREGQFPPKLEISYMDPSGTPTIILQDAPATEQGPSIGPTLDADAASCIEGEMHKCLAQLEP